MSGNFILLFILVACQCFDTVGSATGTAYDL